MKPSAKIVVMKGGPYRVTGGVPLYEKRIAIKDGEYFYEQGRPLQQAQEYYLCRCGASARHPFCDGRHVQAGFTGEETASREPYEARAELLKGETISLLDDGRCALARFCHTGKGDTWELVEQCQDNQQHGQLRELAVSSANACPAGRITVVDNATGERYEPELEPSIEVLQDPLMECSACLFVKGGIPIESADGTVYPVQNRVALCRCGRSQDKPFCDGAHLDGFDDGHHLPEKIN